MKKQSVTITEEDRDLLKSISMGNSKYKGKVSTGIKMLCNIFRSIKQEKSELSMALKVAEHVGGVR